MCICILIFSKEEVEKCKQKDLLMEMLEEMTGEFPALSEVFVKERDTFLAASLRACAQPLPNPEREGGVHSIFCSFIQKCNNSLIYRVHKCQRVTAPCAVKSTF